MPDVQTFRKKPVEVQALRWTGDNAAELEAFAGSNFDALTEPSGDDPDATAAVFDNLHSTWMLVQTGDWIVKGVKGEFYPVRASVFEATYEPSEATPEPAELMRRLAAEIRHEPGEPGEAAFAELFEAGAQAVETPDPALDRVVVAKAVAFALSIAHTLDLVGAAGGRHDG